MAYTVNYKDDGNVNKPAIIVVDGELDNTTDILLVGKNYPRYGEVIAENFLHMLENFASGTAPSRPTEGQLWFDSTNDEVKYYDNISGSGNWKPLASMTVQSAAPTSVGEQDGHMWMDSDTGQLYIYYNGSWRTVSNAGDSQLISRVRVDTNGASHNTLEMVIAQEIVSIASIDGPWVPNSTTTPEFNDNGDLLNVAFPEVSPGITLKNDSTYYFSGTATQALYADLAERYKSDKPYDYGTVVMLGGEAEITECATELCGDVFGVVSTNPGLMLNSGAGENSTHPYIALAGRVPCKVIGLVNKGDRLVSSGDAGYARAVKAGENYSWQHVIGRSIDTKINEEPGLVEIVVGAK